ncbi:MAG: CAP domain-containing protein, partial [Pseudomonadota bacterium]
MKGTRLSAAVVGVTLTLALSCMTMAGDDLPAAAKEAGPPKTGERFWYASAEKWLTAYTNGERKKRGLQALRVGPCLSFAASRHAVNMSNIKLLSHESRYFPKHWTTFNSRLSNVGLDWGGENIAYGTFVEDPRSWARIVVNQWMMTAAHRNNILDPRFCYMGVGLRMGRDRMVYATQV